MVTVNYPIKKILIFGFSYLGDKSLNYQVWQEHHIYP